MGVNCYHYSHDNIDVKTLNINLVVILSVYLSICKFEKFGYKIFSTLKNKSVKKKICKHIKTKMTTFITTKFKKSNEQTNNDKYRVTANITEYHII